MSQIITGRARSIRVALPLTRAGLGLGTPVLTADGEIPVEFLVPGDRIVTHDVGLVTLAHVVARSVPAAEMLRVRPAALDPEAGASEFTVSARQKLYLRGWQARAMFGQPALWVSAGRLADGDYITRLEGAAPMRLFQLVLDSGQHVLMLPNGLRAASAKMPVKVPG